MRQFSSRPLAIQTLALLCVALLPGIRQSRANETEWVSQFGAPGFDAGNAIVRHSTGIYVTGQVGDLPNASNDGKEPWAFVRKYDSRGNLIWDRRHPFGDLHPNPTAIVVDDAQVQIFGSRAEDGTFGITYDLNGNLLRIGDGDGTDPLSTLTQIWGAAGDPTGYYTAGQSYPDCQDQCLSHALLQYRGTRGFWNVVVGAPFDHPFGYRVGASAQAVAVDSTGVYVTGVLGNADVRRYDINGNLLASYGTGSLWGSGIVLDNSGIYIVGLPCPGPCQFATSVRKYDRNGTLLWNRDLPREFQTGTAIALAGNAIFITGSATHNIPSGPHTAYVRKYDVAGNLIWSDEFGPDPGGTVGYGIAAGPSGVYVTGFTDAVFPGQTATPNTDAFVIKRSERPAFTRLLSLGDVNRNGTPDLAAVGHDTRLQANWIVVTDAKTRATIRKITIPDALPAVDASVVPDLNGNASSELAILSAANRRVDVRDSSSGAALGTVLLDPAFSPLRVASLGSISAARKPLLAILQRRDKIVRVEIMNALTGNLARRIIYAVADRFEPKDLAVFADVNQNGAPEVAVLERSTVAGTADKVEIHDSATGNLIRNIDFGSNATSPIAQLLVIPDSNGNSAPELAVLRKGAAGVVIRDAKTAAAVATLTYGADYVPIRMAVVPDLNGNGAPELALLQLHPADGKVSIAVNDIRTRQRLQTIQYGTSATVRPDDLATIVDVNGNKASEIVRLGARLSDDVAIGSARDARTGAAAVSADIRFYP